MVASPYIEVHAAYSSVVPISPYPHYLLGLDERSNAAFSTQVVVFLPSCEQFSYERNIVASV
jgi:hypothetical protein